MEKIRGAVLRELENGEMTIGLLATLVRATHWDVSRVLAELRAEGRVTRRDDGVHFVFGLAEGVGRVGRVGPVGQGGPVGRVG